MSRRTAPIDISDGITILDFLFNAGDAPPCEDAADTEDSGSHNLSDAIYVLNFLFLGGPEPPPPFPKPGSDPTDDQLGCRGF